MQNDCYRIFQNINIFKSHLISNHSEDNQISLNVSILAADLSTTNYNGKKDDFGVPTSDSFVSEDEFIYHFDNTEQNLVDLKEQLLHESAKFTSSFYNELSMNRTHVQTIVDSTRMFVNKIIFSYLKPNVLNFAKNVDSAIQYKIEQVINLFENPFDSLDSEFKRFKYFKEQGTLIEPELYVTGQQTIGKKIDSNYVIVRNCTRQCDRSICICKVSYTKII